LRVDILLHRYVAESIGDKGCIGKGLLWGVDSRKYRAILARHVKR
jgi:hypothetical protein